MNRAQRSRRHDRGISTIETAVLLCAVAVGMAGLVPYVQRAMQGNLKNSTDAVGQQFDVRDEFGLNTDNSVSDGVERVEGGAMPHAPIFTALQGQGQSTFNGQLVSFEDMSWGMVPREPAGWASVQSSATWNSSEDSQYRDDR